MKQPIEQQKAILGTLILQPTYYVAVSDYISPAMFSGPLGPAADFVLGKCRQGAGFDIGMVKDAAGPVVDELINCATTYDLLPIQAIEIRDYYLSTEHLRLMADTARRISNGEADYYEETARLEAMVKALHSQYAHTDDRLNVLTKVWDQLFEMLEHPELTPGVPSGFSDLDEATGGWRPGDLIYIAARPNMGKTTILCEMALAAAQAGAPVAFFSMGDMTADRLNEKFAAMLANVEYKEIRRRNLTGDQKERLFAAFDTLADLQLHVIDNRTVSNRIGAIRDRARVLIERHGVKLVIFDYVQQAAADQPTRVRDQEIGEISRGLKAIAVQCGVPVLAASQLSRAVEIRGGDKRPQMSDLRESGNLEQDADYIFFPYRPEYYQILEDEEGNSLKGVTEFITAKDRMSGDMVGTTYRWAYHNARIVTEAAKRDALTWGPDILPTNGRIVMPRANTDEEVPF